MFFCAISGETPQDPVVSTKSGRVYERRLILKYIADNATDPITGDKLEESDLIDIKADPKTVPPRPPTLSSVPALLHALQNEWDALVLGTFALKQQYNSARQELSYALYAQDAANRVVARLIHERDAARDALANVQASLGVAPSMESANDVEMTEDGASEEVLPKEVVEKIDETHQALSATRKKRKAPEGWVSTAEIKTFSATHTIPSLHAASPAGINSLAVSQTNPSQFLTGGNDKVVQMYDRSTDKVLSTLKGHTKKVNHVALRERDGEPTLVVSGGADKTVKIWAHDAASGQYAPKSTIRTHKGEISGLVVHPSKALLIASSLDSTYTLHDLSTFSQVYRSAPYEEAFTSLAVHPDGTLLALGTQSSTVQIYDIRAGAIAATLAPVDGTPFTVNTISFSENGYQLVAPSSLSSVSIWDLRKSKITHDISLGESFKVNKVLYDFSAQFIGVAGNEGVRVFAHKTWEELARFEEGGYVSDIDFGVNGKELWGASGREIRIWGAPA